MTDYRIIAIVLLGLAVGMPQLVHGQEEESGEIPETQEAEQAPEPEPERQRRGVRRLGDVVSEGDDEWSLDVPVTDAAPILIEEQPDVSLPDEAQDSRLRNLLTRRAFVPEDPNIDVELEALLDEVQADAEMAIDEDEFELAVQMLRVISELDEDRPGLAELNERIEREGRLQQLLVDAEAAYEEGRLVEPEGDNALEYYREILEEDPENETGQAGVANVQQRLLSRAVDQASEQDFEEAGETIDLAEGILDDPESIEEAREAIASMQEEYMSGLAEAVRDAIDEEDYDQAEEAINRLIAFGYESDRIERKRRTLEDARLYGGFEAGQTFTEVLAEAGSDGPSMVVVPAGNFMMGSPDNEDGRSSNEGPRHRVTFRRGFAISETEVSVGQFREFIEATGYRTDAERAGWSRTYDADTGRIDRENGVTWEDDYRGNTASDDLPVIHVSWNDANAYADWLAEQTERDYRLPSEAEYEYALRAGSQTMYWWGEGTPDDVVENLTGDGDVSPTRRRWNVAFSNYRDGYFGPAPVGSFEPNPFGVYDMGGNVMSWVEDCWHDSYARAPSDGTAWVNPGCERRVLRGGNWSASPEMVRSAFRLASSNDSRDARVGFRVARDL